jgi:gliding motility-associated-like protein
MKLNSSILKIISSFKFILFSGYSRTRFHSLRTLLLFFILSLSASLSAQTTDISGIINVYSAVTSIKCNDLTVSNPTGFKSGDKVLIIQMKGGKINLTNSASFGTITNYNNAGNYEFAYIDVINGQTISLTQSLTGQYTLTDFVQIVNVPRYKNAIVSSKLTAAAWNGSSGGILALEIENNLTLNAPIEVSGLGFRGGTTSANYYNGCTSIDYFYASNQGAGAGKGESITNSDANFVNGRGAIANGGGGGNHVNAGGGGGSNSGTGGKGGNEWDGCSMSALGGEGGYSLNYSNALNKIFLGGGGGGGHQNNSEGTPGTSGGGIIFISADSIKGNNFLIKSDGLDNGKIAGIDGSGGAGSGGTVLLNVKGFSHLSVSAKGGIGGSYNGASTCHGPGGGGGGGTIWFSTLLTNTITDVRGGQAGLILVQSLPCFNTSYGAGAGTDGQLIFGLKPPDIAQNQIIKVSICKGQSYLGFDKTGIYRVKKQVANGCDSIVTIDLTVNGIRDTVIYKSICPGEQFLGYNKSGTYNDIIKDPNGCESKRNLILTLNRTADTTIIRFICAGFNFKLPNDKVVNLPGIYISNLKTSIGCDSVVRVNLKLLNNNNDSCLAPNIMFPSAFSPNFDLLNDEFKPVISGNSENILFYDLKIFNRWGELVFSSKDFNEGWKGDYLAKPCPLGNYFYTCKINSFETGQVQGSSFKGVVLLVR